VESNPEADRPAPVLPEIRAALELLAALCAEHVLLIGPPGTAKSELARRLRSLVGGRYFERLLTRFTVPEELFGPLSLAALDEGRYLREVAGYLPTATVAFLDEVFKANSAILNALLTLLNERAFDQGAERMRVPLATLVAASNEVPADAALQAFLDRFLFRCTVAPVAGDAFEALLRSGAGPSRSADAADDDEGSIAPVLPAALAGRVAAAADRVEVPAGIVEALGELRGLLAESALEVSDRRWVRTVRVLRVAAATQGRIAVTDVDLWLLRWLLALDTEQTARIDAWVADRLGGARALEPVRLARVAQAWDKQLDIEQSATELAFDDSGKLALAKGLGGADEGTMSDAAPRMSAFSRRRRFSATHVRARLAQLDALLVEIDAWLDGAAAHHAAVVAGVAGNPWIDPGFAMQVQSRLEAGERSVRALRDGIADTRGAFASLPLSETDDGRIPAPVPA